MNTESTFEPVRRSTEVVCGPAEAFRFFTDEIDSWWPLATHSVGAGDAVSCCFQTSDHSLTAGPGSSSGSFVNV